MLGTRFFIVSMAICACATPAFSDGKLWLGSSIADAVIETDTGGREAAIVAQSGISGIAFDGANLYFEDGKGNITKRTADGISVRGANHVGFEIAGYDAAKPLIIDPVLSYASYLGGVNDELAAAVAVDPQGNAYVTGSTSSANFPVGHSLSPGSDVSPHNWDVFVTKLNPSGSALIYSTYVGGSEEEGGFGIAAIPAAMPM